MKTQKAVWAWVMAQGKEVRHGGDPVRDHDTAAKIARAMRIAEAWDRWEADEGLSESCETTAEWHGILARSLQAAAEGDTE